MARPGKLLLLALALGSCSSEMRLENGTPTPEVLACARTGGTLQARGKRGLLMCVHAFGDAGKSCSSGSDCQGRCLATSGDGGLPKIGDSAHGRCQADDRLFGCFAALKDGKVKSAMCVD